jgi:hypothetical protein
MRIIHQIEMAKHRPAKLFWNPLSLVLVAAFAITLLVGVISSTPLTATLDHNAANLFLATTAQVFGGILAIVFSISALVVTIVADRYSHQLISKFTNDRLTRATFFVLLACAVVALLSINISLPMYQAGFLGMVLLTSVGFGLLLWYLAHALQLIKPETMAQLLIADGLECLRNQDNDGFFRVLSSIGDVTLKAFARQEDNIAEIYLRALDEVHQGWIKSHRMPAQGEIDQVWSTMVFGRQSPIMNQFKRVFKVFLSREDETLTRLVEQLSGGAIDSLLPKRDEEQLLNGLLTQYQELAQLAIEQQNAVRFAFLRFYRDRIRSLVGATTGYLALCKKAFVETCAEVIKNDDVELWRRTLNFYCGGFSSIAEQNHTLRNDNLSQLWQILQNEDPSTDWRQPYEWTNWLANLLQPQLTIERQDLFELSLYHVAGRFSGDHLALRQIEQIRISLHELQAANHLIDAFFQVGIEALSLGRYPYIKSLLLHCTSQPDTYMLIPDLGYALTQVTYYARNARYQYRDSDKEELVHSFCFVYLACALHKSKQKEWAPMNLDFNEAMLSADNEFSEALTADIRNTYRFLSGFSHEIKAIVQQYDFIAAKSEEWDDLFDGNAAQAFQNARNWLTNQERIQRWQNSARQLVERLPVDGRRRDKHFAHLRQSFESNFRIDQLATITETLPADVPSKQLKSQAHCDKIEFTILRGTNRQIDGPALVGSDLAKQEVDHLVQTVLSEENVPAIRAESLTFNAVNRGVEQIVGSGGQPTILMVSHAHYKHAHDIDPEFRTRIRPGTNISHLVMDGSLELAILIDRNLTECALVLDPHSGNWSRLGSVEPSVSVCPQDALKIHLAATEMIQYQLVNPQGGVVLRFNPAETSNDSVWPNNYSLRPLARLVKWLSEIFAG